MKKAIGIGILALATILILANLASAIVIDSVSSERLVPGERARVKITIKNTLDDDVEDVSLTLDLSGLPLSSVGSTEDGVGTIESGKDKDLGYIIRASNSAEPGDYNIPYALTYKGQSADKTGTIGITVSGEADLAFSIDRESPVVGHQGKITLKIVNKGVAEARFVSLKVLPSGFTLLSEPDAYIGEIDSDDFESETFDVVFDSINPLLSAVVEYTDFDNRVIEKNVNIPVMVYSEEKALELGIISKSYAPIYFGIVAGVFIIWFVWRKVSKRRKRKLSEGR